MTEPDSPRPDPASRPAPAAETATPATPAAGPAGQPARRTQRTPSLHSGRPIVPREGVAGQALLTVIAIMAFLACLTLGAVFMVRDTASGWQSDIAREVTVQIRPFDNVDMDKAIRDASRLILSFEGISKVTALDDDAAAQLLEPFLGAGIKVAELPIPALLTVTVSDGARPDFAAISDRLTAEIPGASLDDHRAWIDRLNTMATTTVAAGAIIFLLVMTATILTVIFATRGAMAANRQIVDVLHFVGADRTFIAREFETHFLRIGMIGALAGGLASIFLFLALGFWASTRRTTAEGEQVVALFGTFSVSFWALLGIFLVAVAIAVLTGLTTRITVMRHVGRLETYGGSQQD
ncbi:MAG: ABC transporter permease [Nitratireductor sp.]|nr:ABC transporter permease [Nitratireductor sp.]